MVLLRKSLHTVLAVMLAVAAPYLTPLHTTYIGGSLLALFGGSYYVRWLDPIRQAERASFGEFFFALGILLMGFLVLEDSVPAFQAGMLVLGFADPLAAIVGKRWGKRVYRVFGERRTLEGSATCAFVSGVVLVAFGASLTLAIPGAAVLALVEALAPHGSDNLLLPLVAAAILLV